MRLASPLAAASALLLAIHALPARAQAPNCNEGCMVTINVPAGCGSGIQVAPDPIVVSRDRAVTITWTLSDETWRFDEKGIDIKQWDGYAAAAFENKPASPVGKQYRVKNVNKKVATYKYDVNLVHSKSGEKCKLDPIIINH